MRKIVSNYILTTSNSEFNNILSFYRQEVDFGEFKGGWNPYTIFDRSELAYEILKGGFNFEGDYITLSIISKLLDIDIIILIDSLPSKNIVRIESPKDTNKFIMLRYCHNHYETVGVDKGRFITTLFRNKNILKRK